MKFRSLSLVLLTAVVTGVGLLGGVQATSDAVFPFWASVYGAVVGGPNILVMLAVAVLTGGVPVVMALHHRWPAHHRTRVDVRRWIDRVTLLPMLTAAVVVFVAMIVWGTFVFVWLAQTDPGLVDLRGYGFDGGRDQELARRFPLWAWTGGNAVPFVLLSALWAAIHAAIAAAIAVCCALLISSRVLALLAPVALVLGVGIGAEMTVGPIFSPIQTWLHPGGLTFSDPIMSLVPAVALGVAVLLTLLATRHRAPYSARFS